MKKIGIVGGVAWLSTVDYYSEICRMSEQWYLARQLPGAPSTPEMSIESLDLNKAISYLGVDGDEKSWSQFDDYHRAALQRLEASGADFALIASNTPHHRFEPIVRGIGIPVIDIFDAVAKESARIGASDVLILGTALTMRSPRFRDKFAQHEITAVGPSDKAARAILNQQTHTNEPPMTNSREHSQEELRRQILAETNISAPENIRTPADIEHRHNAPIQTALPNEASDYAWKRETGEVQSYQHTHGGSWLHIDPQGQFYDRQAQPITRETALEQAGQSSAHSLSDNTQMQSGSKDTSDLGLSL